MVFPLPPLLDAVTWLSTHIMFVLLLAATSERILSVVFSLDILIIIATIGVRHYFEKLCLVYPMLRSMGLSPPYSKRKVAALHRVYERGLAGTDWAAEPPPPTRLG
jgi:hypothetical protein